MAASVALSVFVLAANLPLCGVLDGRCHADHAAAAHELRLEPEGVDHIRVFRSRGLADSPTAWILLPPTSNAGARGSELITVHDAATFVAFAELGHLDGKLVACGVKDGVGYIVDGYLEGRRVAFTASNPTKCSSSEASAVAAALGLLPEQRNG